MAEQRDVLHGLHGGLGAVRREPTDSQRYQHLRQRADAEVWNAKMAGRSGPYVDHLTTGR